MPQGALQQEGDFSYPEVRAGVLLGPVRPGGREGGREGGRGRGREGGHSLEASAGFDGQELRDEELAEVPGKGRPSLPPSLPPYLPSFVLPSLPSSFPGRPRHQGCDCALLPLRLRTSAPSSIPPCGLSPPSLPPSLPLPQPVDRPPFLTQRVVDNHEDDDQIEEKKGEEENEEEICGRVASPRLPCPV
jgi:hypothetical protein